MVNGTYLGLSAQLALQRRLDTIATNVANAGTAGFRAEQIRFTVHQSPASVPQLDFAGIGETYLDRGPGEFVNTGNALDIAVEGSAWLAISTPQGIAYTRDGRLQIGPEGELMTLTGHNILDSGGAEIRLDPAGGAPSIARDGTITQRGRTAGIIGLFTIDPIAKLDRGPDASVFPSLPAQPVADDTLAGVKQGYMERSNVNPVLEMSRLILDQRTFEAVSSVLGETEQLKSDAIRSLGPS